MTTFGTEIPAPVDPSSIRWHERLLLLVIPVLVAIAYLPALRGEYIWDDDSYVLSNLTLRTAEGLRDIWLVPRASPQYYPLVFTTFWIEYQFWGLHPLGYHLVNAMLHAGNAMLLFLVLRKLNVPAAAVIAAIFAVHPVHVESVAWVTERKNVLSAFMFMLAFLAYLRFWPPDADRPRRWGWYVAALVFFVLALLSKTVTCTLPVTLLIVAWLRRGRVTWRDIAAVAPMLLIGAAAGLMTAAMETSHVGASGDEWSLSWLGRCVLAARVSIFYAMKDLWPNPLIFFYPRWNIDPSQPMQLAIPIAVLALVVLLFLLRHRIRRAPLAVVALYLVTLFPAMGFFNVYPMRYSYVADHFQYLASIPVIAGVVAGAALLLRRMGADRPGIVGPIVAIVLLTLSVLTFRQSHAYKDHESLWRDTIAKNPGAWAAWNNLGLLLAERGQYDDALRNYEHVMRIKPENAAGMHLNIAMVREAQGRLFEAEASYHEALRVEPKHSASLINLSTLHGKRGNMMLAESYARQALQLVPDSIPARLNLATAAAGQGRIDEAITVLHEALRLRPWVTDVRVALAIQLFNSGRRGEGLEQARTAARRDPESRLARGVLAQLESAAQTPPPAPSPPAPPRR